MRNAEGFYFSFCSSWGNHLMWPHCKRAVTLLFIITSIKPSNRFKLCGRRRWCRRWMKCPDCPHSASAAPWRRLSMNSTEINSKKSLQFLSCTASFFLRVGMETSNFLIPVRPACSENRNWAVIKLQVWSSSSLWFPCSLQAVNGE